VQVVAVVRRDGQRVAAALLIDREAVEPGRIRRARATAHLDRREPRRAFEVDVARAELERDAADTGGGDVEVALGGVFAVGVGDERRRDERERSDEERSMHGVYSVDSSHPMRAGAKGFTPRRSPACMQPIRLARPLLRPLQRQDEVG